MHAPHLTNHWERVRLKPVIANFNESYILWRSLKWLSHFVYICIRCALILTVNVIFFFLSFLSVRRVLDELVIGTVIQPPICDLQLVQRCEICKKFEFSCIDGKICDDLSVFHHISVQIAVFRVWNLLTFCDVSRLNFCPPPTALSLSFSRCDQFSNPLIICIFRFLPRTELDFYYHHY